MSTRLLLRSSFVRLVGLWSVTCGTRTPWCLIRLRGRTRMRNNVRLNVGLRRAATPHFREQTGSNAGRNMAEYVWDFWAENARDYYK